MEDNTVMKKILFGVLAATLLAAPAGADQHSGTLKKIKDSGTITIGYREQSNPFSFLDEAKKPVGYSIDLCQRVVNTVKSQLGVSALKVNYVPLSAENRFGAVAEGTVDILCGNSTNTLSRQKQVAFSNMTFVTGASFLVNSDSPVNDVKDFAGKSIGVVAGTSTESALADEIKKHSLNTKIVTYTDHESALAALESGKIVAYAADRVVLIGLGRNAKDPSKLLLADQLFTYEPYGLVFRRGDADFALAVNTALAETYRSGDIAKIYEKWFGAWGARPSKLLLAMYALNALPE